MDTKNTRSVNIEFGTILNKIEKENRTKTFRVVSPVSVASVKGTEFAAMINPSGVDQFIGKEGLFDVFNSVSGQTVSVGPGQKALSGSSGSLMQAPASPNEYPQDPELETDIKEKKKPSEREDSKKNETDIQKEDIEINDSRNENKSDQINNSSTNNEIDSNESPKADDVPSAPKKPFGMGLGIGSAKIDGTLYNQLALRPEINFAGIGVGLDLVVYMDDEGNIREDEWNFDDNPDLVYDKILYVRYGEKSSPFWAKYGSIENMTYCVGVNRTGKDGNGHQYIGHSAVYNVLGEQVSTSNFEENFIETIIWKKSIEHLI